MPVILPSRPVRSQRARNTVGVVDIGSNTVRLVVYEGYRRAPVPMFNESAHCGLGRGLARNGALEPEAMDSALRTIGRFSRLARSMGVKRLHFIATAAVRDASNGAEFAERVFVSCGEEIEVLTGEDEARLSALGVISGVPDAHGTMADLGGGSLELVDVRNGVIKRQATLPLGVLRLIDLHKVDRRMALKEIRSQLATVDWLGSRKGRAFYPVGGAWRTIARLHMEHAEHPLHIIDGYRISPRELNNLNDIVASLGPQSVQQISVVSRRRRASLPIACDMLVAVLEETRAKQVVFSAHGLREGYLYSQLRDNFRARDPVLEAARTLAAREARFGAMGETLAAWIEPLFKGRHLGRQRVRLVACHLTDIAWREHPDYRAIQALHRIQRFPFMGLSHDERAFLGYVAYVRYGGSTTTEDAALARRLMSNRQVRRAEIVGLAARVAFRVSGGAPGVLKRSRLIVEDDTLSLELPHDGSSPLDDSVERRFNALVEASRMKRGNIIA